MLGKRQHQYGDHEGDGQYENFGFSAHGVLELGISFLALAFS